MTYLIIGPDGPDKAARITALKNKYLLAPDSKNFDLDVLYALKLDPRELKETLHKLPAVSPARLIILHDCHKFTAEHKDIVFDFISSKAEHAVVVMESSQWSDKDSFVKRIKKDVQVMTLAPAYEPNVFDITRAMEHRQYKEALSRLDDILKSGVYPLQLMGVLIWFWGQSRRRLNQKRYEEGLKYLKEADIDIKRSRIRPEFAMERLVVRLCTVLD